MKKYQINNWSQYNKSLIQRGSITLWFSNEYIEKWRPSSLSGKKGRPNFYSDDAILCCLMIRTIYHLPLRSLQGFLFSIARLLNLSISIPSYTQICRRAKGLGKKLKKLSSRRPYDIVFDSTGLKVYGEGEWKVKQHGVSKRRMWRKLHIGMDPNSGEIIVAELTDNGVGSGDGKVAGEMIKKVPKGLKNVYGDGAYDSIKFRKEIDRIGAHPIIPPQRGAIISNRTESVMIERDNAIKEILGLGGDEEAIRLWKQFKGYHKRSLLETAMYRIKQITGSGLRSREKKKAMCRSSH